MVRHRGRPRSARAARVRLPAQQRRESILTAATDVFARNGYERAKVSDVAAQLDVTTPVIYQNFGTKPALFAAVLDRAATDMCDQLAAAAVHAPSVSALLEAALSPEHREHIATPGPIGVVFADAAALTAEPKLAESVQRAIQRVADALGTLLEQGKATGDIRDDLDTESTTWWLLTLVAGRGFRAAATPDRHALEARLATLTLRALAADDERRSPGTPMREPGSVT